jgi:hypothetical protein
MGGIHPAYYAVVVKVDRLIGIEERAEIVAKRRRAVTGTRHRGKDLV